MFKKKKKKSGEKTFSASAHMLVPKVSFLTVGEGNKPETNFQKFFFSFFFFFPLKLLKFRCVKSGAHRSLPHCS